MLLSASFWHDIRCSANTGNYEFGWKKLHVISKQSGHSSLAMNGVFGLISVIYTINVQGR